MSEDVDIEKLRTVLSFVRMKNEIEWEKLNFKLGGIEEWVPFIDDWNLWCDMVFARNKINNEKDDSGVELVWHS